MFIIFIGIVRYEKLLNNYNNNSRLLQKQYQKEKDFYQTKNDSHGSIKGLQLKEEMLQTQEKYIVLLEENIKLKNDIRNFDDEKSKNENRVIVKEDVTNSSIAASKDEYNILLKKYSIIKEESIKLKTEEKETNKINKNLHEENLALRANFEVFKKEYQHRLRALNEQKEEIMKDKIKASHKKYENLYEEHSVLGANFKSLKKELQSIQALSTQKENICTAEIGIYKKKYADLNNRFVSLRDEMKESCTNTNTSPDDEKKSSNSDINYKHQYEDLSSDYFVLKDEHDELKKKYAEYKTKNSNQDSYEKAYSDILNEYLILQDVLKEFINNKGHSSNMNLWSTSAWKQKNGMFSDFKKGRNKKGRVKKGGKKARNRR